MINKKKENKRVGSEVRKTRVIEHAPIGYSFLSLLIAYSLAS